MTNAQAEPSMEEILASIRRIISEDEEEGAAPTPEPENASPFAAIEAAAEAQSAEVVEEEPLAEIVEPEPALETVESVADDYDDAEPRLNTEDVEMIKTDIRETIERETPMIGEASATAATKAFQNLSQSVRVSGGDGHTLEDIVMELLKPMLKDWLDQNLATIVEEKVEEEVQRLARRGR